jgi:hypothetical protein
VQSFARALDSTATVGHQSWTKTADSVALVFLDSVAMRGRQPSSSGPLEWPQTVANAPSITLDHAAAIAEVHFATTHEWLPVISKKKLSRQLQGGRAIIRADFTSMLYAMDLLSRNNTNGSQGIYHAIKAALEISESHWQMSTAFLAAQVLLAFYELGQGLFPTVYYTVARCARLCQALGLHDKRKATQLLLKADSWTEVEERRRLWWAVLILDRYVHLGFRFRALSIPYIPPDEIIPANDEQWDEGEQAVNPLLVMSIEASTNVSPFARVCQAAHLVGRVCQHVNEHPSAEHADLHFQEAYQISRATNALLTMLDEERRRTDKSSRLLTSRALCYSALLLLYDVHSCVEVDEIEACGGNRGLRVDLQQLSIDGYKTIAPRVCELGRELEQCRGFQGGVTPEICPTTLHCLYSTAGVYAWYVRENGNNSHLDRLNELRSILNNLQSRWHLAGKLISF